MIDDTAVALSDEREMQMMNGLPLNEQRKVVIIFHEEVLPSSFRVLSNEAEYKELALFKMKNPSAQT